MAEDILVQKPLTFFNSQKRWDKRVRMTVYKCLYVLSLISKLTRPKGETWTRYFCLKCKYKGFNQIIFKNQDPKLSSNPVNWIIVSVKPLQRRNGNLSYLEKSRLPLIACESQTVSKLTECFKLIISSSIPIQTMLPHTFSEI